ncbi:MAG: uridine kinase [Saprospiraceae bacterium]|nr:uridine kinase [Saprospiraceae bacterium]
MEKPFIIGITGGSGSGKTGFIRELESQFGENELTIISQDDYYKPRTQQKKDKKGVINFDRPVSIDKAAFLRDIQELVAGNAIERIEYTFNNEEATPKTLHFRPAPILIVEGLFVFHFRKIRRLMDLKVFLHAKENLKVVRRIKRDKHERNYPLEDVLYRYEHHVLPSYEKYILPHKDKADIIINNNKNYHLGLRVITGFLRNFLAKVKSGVNT